MDINILHVFSPQGSFSLIIEAWHSPYGNLPVGKCNVFLPQEGALSVHFTHEALPLRGCFCFFEEIYAQMNQRIALLNAA